MVAALWKKGTSLTRLSRRRGYAACALKLALRKPWPKAEKIIADALGERPQDIWPSRYNTDGTPNRTPGNPQWVRGRKQLVAHRRRLAA